MIGAGDWSSLSAPSRQMLRNEVLPLEGDLRGLTAEARLGGSEDCLVFVESGSVALFAVDLRDGAPAGPRQLLTDIGAGRAVFSVAQALDHRTHLVIVPIEDTAIRVVALRDVRAETAFAPWVDSMLETWVELLAGRLTGYHEPKLPVRVGGEREGEGDGGGEAVIDLQDGRELRPERKTVVWCRVLSGEVRCMGHDDMSLQAEDGWFPLDSGMWLTAAGEVSIETRRTSELRAHEDLARGLQVLQALVLSHVRTARERETAAERIRMQQLDRLQAESQDEALAELAAVLQPRVASNLGDTPLLRAFSAIGKELDVAIRPAMQSEPVGVEGEPIDAVEAIEAIARASHVRTRRVKLKRNWWRWDCGALLCFTKDLSRPVALLRRSALRYEIYDPVDETYTRVTEHTAQLLAGEAWMVYRPLPAGKLRLADLFRFSVVPRRRELGLVILAGIAATLLGMVTPQATAVLMDTAIPDANTQLLFELGMGLLAAAFGRTVFSLSQGILLTRLGLASGAETQAAVWDRLLLLRPAFFRRFSSGDLQSRVMAVDEITQELSGVTLSSLFSGLLAGLNLALLYYYSPQLTLLALAVGVVVSVFTVAVGLMMRKTLRQLLELDGALFGVVVQLIDGVSKLRVAGAGDRAFTHWLKKYTATLKLWSTSFLLRDVVTVFNSLIPTLGTAALYLMAYQTLVDGRQATGESGMSLGTFLAFSAAFGTFLAGVTSLSNTAVSLLDVFAQGRRIQPILQAEPEMDAGRADPGCLTGRVGLSGVQFRYRDDGPMVLDGVDVSAGPGEFIALVGPSGGGKSTILRLLLGFESPAVGVVTYDGQDLADLDLVGVRRQIGVVLQSGRLDAGSIFENIACGRALSLTDAWAALTDAGFAEEVREMPMGVHTVISVGGDNLSGGQRQRLLIARALAHRPRVLLFDEATGALDNRTQAIVSESLDQLNVTRVVIAHRLSTIQNADCIYVVDGGRVVQRGRFDQLIAEEGSLFARMMSRQLA